MAKLVSGLAVLGVMFSITLLTSIWFEGEIKKAETLVDVASAYAEQGSLGDAGAALEKAKTIWEQTEKIALIFIHSGKIESINDAFFEYLNALEDNDDDTQWLKERLLYYLRSAAESEKLSPGTIL